MRDSEIKHCQSRGSIVMSRKQKLNLEEKVKIIRDYLKGSIGICEAAQKGGVGRKTMYQWVRNYQADGVEAFLPHKNRVYSPGQISLYGLFL